MLPGAEAERLASPGPAVRGIPRRRGGRRPHPRQPSPSGQGKVLLHGHCHQKAFGAMAAVQGALALVRGPQRRDGGDRAVAAWPARSATRRKPMMPPCRMGELALLPAVRKAPPKPSSPPTASPAGTRSPTAPAGAPVHVARKFCARRWRNSAAGAVQPAGVRSRRRTDGRSMDDTSYTRLLPERWTLRRARQARVSDSLPSQNKARSEERAISMAVDREGGSMSHDAGGTVRPVSIKSQLDFAGGLFLLALALLGLAGGFNLPSGTLSGIGSGLMPRVCGRPGRRVRRAAHRAVVPVRRATGWSGGTCGVRSSFWAPFSSSPC